MEDRSVTTRPGAAPSVASKTMYAGVFAIVSAALLVTSIVLYVTRKESAKASAGTPPASAVHSGTKPVAAAAAVRTAPPQAHVPTDSGAQRTSVQRAVAAAAAGAASTPAALKRRGYDLDDIMQGRVVPDPDPATLGIALHTASGSATPAATADVARKAQSVRGVPVVYNPDGTKVNRPQHHTHAPAAAPNRGPFAVRTFTPETYAAMQGPAAHVAIVVMPGCGACHMAMQLLHTLIQERGPSALPSNVWILTQADLAHAPVLQGAAITAFPTFVGIAANHTVAWKHVGVPRGASVDTMLAVLSGAAPS